MTEILIPIETSSLLSPRTASYVEALVREGDNFDYSRWLERVRAEKTRAKPGARSLSTLAGSNRLLGGPPENRSEPANVKPLFMAKRISVLRAIPRPIRNTESETPDSRLRRRLEQTRGAWNDFQTSRVRDAVYGYLAAVFSIVVHYKVRRRTTRLLRHAFKFANLPFDKNADPFAVVIRCTSGRDINAKTISKLSRALRYVARSKVPDSGLRTFMKEAGGVNVCAGRYARSYGRRAKL
jgi:hypothetical protein